MTVQAIFVLLPYILSALISLWMGIEAVRRRSVPGSLLFAWMTFSEVVWTLGYIFQLISTDLAGKLFWNNAQFIGAIGAPLAILGFALEYDRPVKSVWSHVSWKYFAPFALLLLAFIWSDGIHHLFRQQAALQAGQPFSKLVFQDGPGFSLYTIFAYGLLVLTTLVLLPRYLQAAQLYRLQIGVVLIGALIPWVTSVITALALIPARLHDATPITFGISNLIIAWALFRYHLFEVLPAARDFLVENMQEGVLVVDYQMRVIDVNPAAEEILGLREVRALGKSVLSLSPFEQTWFQDVTAENSRKIEVVIERDGYAGVYELQISQLSSSRDQAVVYLLILRDICDRKRIEEKLNYLAITDSLTRIFNRRYVLQRAAEEIEQAQQSGRPLALILFDIDHFKQVNDTFGHRMGDQLLQALTARCQAALRSQDIFGRYGGEEFLVVLPDATIPAARLIAERLRSQVESLSLDALDGAVRVTVSLGIAGTGEHTDSDLDAMLDWADQAMYRAKEEGRNRACVYGRVYGPSSESVPR